MFDGKDGEEFITKLFGTTIDISNESVVIGTYDIIVSDCIDVGKYIWNNYRNRYNNDDSECHGVKHLREVMLTSFKLCIKYRNRIDTVSLKEALLMSTIASIVHDSYSYTDRDNHHEVASIDLLEYLKNEEVNNFISKKFTDISIDNKFIDIVCSMVYEHRASYNHNFSHVMCELFSAADRGMPNFDSMFKRTLSFNKLKTNFKLDVDKNIDIVINNSGKYSTTYSKFYFENSVKFKGEIKDYIIFSLLHMMDKFSRNGYAFNRLKENGIYKNYFGKELEQLYLEIEKLFLVKPDILKHLVNNYIIK